MLALMFLTVLAKLFDPDSTMEFLVLDRWRQAGPPSLGSRHRRKRHAQILDQFGLKPLGLFELVDVCPRERDGTCPGRDF